MRGEDEEIGAPHPREHIVGLAREQHRFANPEFFRAGLERRDPPRFARPDDHQPQRCHLDCQRGGVDQPLEVLLLVNPPDRQHHRRPIIVEPGVRGGRLGHFARAIDVDAIGDIGRLARRHGALKQRLFGQRPPDQHDALRRRQQQPLPAAAAKMRRPAWGRPISLLMR